jgi:hypothetical protein
MSVAAVSSSVADQVTAFAARFRVARPFPHLVIDEFLEGAFCRQLQRECPKFDRGQARNELGEIGGRRRIRIFRGSAKPMRSLTGCCSHPSF